MFAGRFRFSDQYDIVVLWLERYLLQEAADGLLFDQYIVKGSAECLLNELVIKRNLVLVKKGQGVNQLTLYVFPFDKRLASSHIVQFDKAAPLQLADGSRQGGGQALNE